ncbi:MAG: XrtA/PEP-CTERM system exopolysaccharide export protein [Pseudomonadales bacterium]
MKIVARLVTIIAGALVLASCGGQPKIQDIPIEVSNYSEQPYVLGVGDELDIQVWRNPDLSTSVPVRPDGRISTPLVGDIIAAGVTAEDLGRTIEDKLSQYIRNPQVTVVVTQASSRDYQQRVRVTGAVVTPTSLAYRDGMTVLDLILEAGGTNEFAVPNRTNLFRKSAEGTKVYPVYLNDILKKGKLETNYPLLPSDIITVPERGF